MKNKLDDFYSLYDVECKYLQSISCERVIDSIGSDSLYNIRLVLSNYKNERPKNIVIFFQGAVDIKIGRLDGLLGMLLEIENISSHGLENINFLVHETEYDIFSFMCKDFVIELGAI